MPARLTAREGVCPACGAAGAPSAMTVAGHSFRRCRSCLTLFIGEAPANLHEQYEGRRYFVDDGFGSA
ncbi:MAG: hypothetical protein M3131_01075, partial [Actinomycetota bacterium]|nr:hypothetical protein [Actinomycetota bacterium]